MCSDQRGTIVVVSAGQQDGSQNTPVTRELEEENRGGTVGR